MAERDNYPALEQVLTVFVILDFLLFLGYLISGITAATVLKYIFAVLSIAGGAFGIYMLINTKEIGRHRSRWILYCFICIPLCTAVSLICQFP